MEPEGFGSHEAVRTRRGASKALLKELQDGLWPRRRVVTTGSAWDPQRSLLAGTGQAVIRAQSVESASRNFKLVRSLCGGQLLFSKTLQDVTNEGWGVSVEQLLVLFRSVASGGPARLANQFVAQSSSWSARPPTTQLMESLSE